MDGVVSFQHTAAHTTSWTVPSDSLITAVNQSTSVLISTDPNDTITNAFTPTANRITFDIVLVTNSTVMKTGLLIPLLKDTVILVGTSAAGTVQLYLNDPATVLLS